MDPSMGLKKSLETQLRLELRKSTGWTETKELCTAVSYGPLALAIGGVSKKTFKSCFFVGVLSFYHTYILTLDTLSGLFIRKDDALLSLRIALESADMEGCD